MINQKAGRFQIATTIFLIALLAFLVIFFLSKANAQELEIHAIGKQNLTQQTSDGYIDRYAYVNPGEEIKFQVVYKYLNGNNKTITVYTNPNDLVWEIDGNQTDLRSSQHYSHYMVPFSYGWDAMTVVARSYRYQNLEAYFYLYNSAYNDQAYNDDQGMTYTDYDYYQDIPDEFDSQVIIEKHFIPIYVDGYRFYRFRSPLVGYTPYTCGQFVMTSWGLRYIPCRDYPWEWIWAYRGCPIYHNTYGWLWYWDAGINIAGIHLGINFYYANNWIYYHPYNPYYQHIYDMGYRNGWYDRDRIHRHAVVVPRDGFLHHRVKDIMVRNVDGNRMRASMIARNQLKDLRHKEFERILGKKVDLVRGPKDEKVFKGDFRGRLKEAFEGNRIKRGSVLARGNEQKGNPADNKDRTIVRPPSKDRTEERPIGRNNPPKGQIDRSKPKDNERVITMPGVERPKPSQTRDRKTPPSIGRPNPSQRNDRSQSTVERSKPAERSDRSTPPRIERPATQRPQNSNRNSERSTIQRPPNSNQNRTERIAPQSPQPQRIQRPKSVERPQSQYQRAERPKATERPRVQSPSIERPKSTDKPKSQAPRIERQSSPRVERSSPPTRVERQSPSQRQERATSPSRSGGSDRSGGDRSGKKRR